MILFASTVKEVSQIVPYVSPNWYSALPLPKEMPSASLNTPENGKKLNYVISNLSIQ